MAAKINITLQGGITVPVYALVTSVTRDRLTGDVRFALRAFKDANTRAAHAAAWETLRKALLAIEDGHAAYARAAAMDVQNDPEKAAERDAAIEKARRENERRADAFRAARAALDPNLQPLQVDWAGQMELPIADAIALAPDSSPEAVLRAIYGYLGRPGNVFADAEQV